MRAHPAFWVVLAISAALGLFRELLTLLVAVTLHEMAHVVMGLIFHARIGRVLITPLGEAAEINGMERKGPWARAAVILAGPAANLIIGFCGAGLFHAYDAQMPARGFGLGYFFASNIALGVFNLLPAFPLDGGRIWQLILGNTWVGAARADKLLCRASQITGVLIMAAGVVQFARFSYNISLFCVGIFIVLNIRKERLKLSFEFHRHFNGHINPGRALPKKLHAAPASTSLNGLLNYLRWDSLAMFYIYFEDGEGAFVSEGGLMERLSSHGADGAAGDLVAASLRLNLSPQKR